MAITEAEVLAQNAKAAPQRLTYARYLAEYLTEPVTTQPCEILDGVRVYMTSPNWRHQQIAILLVALLQQYKAVYGGQVALAPLDVLIDPVSLRVRQPDVLYLSDTQFQAGGGAPDLGPLTVAPELVIEILSPSETRRILHGKIADFCHIGVQECWVISPQSETVEVLRLTPDGPQREQIYSLGQTVQSLAFPALTLAVDDIFGTED